MVLMRSRVIVALVEKTGEERIIEDDEYGAHQLWLVSKLIMHVHWSEFYPFAFAFYRKLNTVMRPYSHSQSLMR
jgi:hypothetical protein